MQITRRTFTAGAASLLFVPKLSLSASLPKAAAWVAAIRWNNDTGLQAFASKVVGYYRDKNKEGNSRPMPAHVLVDLNDSAGLQTFHDQRLQLEYYVVATDVTSFQELCHKIMVLQLRLAKPYRSRLKGFHSTDATLHFSWFIA